MKTKRLKTLPEIRKEERGFDRKSDVFPSLLKRRKKLILFWLLKSIISSKKG